MTLPYPARDRLLQLLRTHAYKSGTHKLSSGRMSDFFIDCKQVILTAEGHALVGEVLYNQLVQSAQLFQARYGKLSPTFNAVAGVALGGCSLASTVAYESFQRRTFGTVRVPGHNLYDALYIRREAKDHGSRTAIEGRVAPGSSVVLLEDVVTTGESSIKAIDQLRIAGHIVPLAIVLVDRQEGGMEAIRSHGTEAVSIFTRADFVGLPMAKRPRVIYHGVTWYYGGPSNDACTLHHLYRDDGSNASNVPSRDFEHVLG